MPDAAGLVIASDHADARAYAALLRGMTGTRPSWCCPTIRRRARRSPRSPPPATAGWSRCGWCPRGWTSRGWRSASTRPACAPRCSSPRPSAGSSAPGSGARPHRCSCLRSRRCSAYAAELEAERDHVLAPRSATTAEEDASSPRPSAQRDTAGRARRPAVPGAEGVGAFRPGAVRRRRVRTPPGGLRGRGLPRAARPAARPTRSRGSCCAAARTPRSRAGTSAAAARQPASRAGTAPPRARGAGRAAQGTQRAGGAPGTTAPASRTASSTPSCAAPAAAPSCRRRPRSRSRPASTRSAAGPSPAAKIQDLSAERIVLPAPGTPVHLGRP